jgi:steroid delta-isomerase-like uncharacterized protein
MPSSSDRQHIRGVVPRGETARRDRILPSPWSRLHLTVARKVIGATLLQEEENPMSVAENKAIVRRYIEEVWNQGNLEVIDDLCHLDVVGHSDHFGATFGTEERRRVTGAFQRAFPGIILEIHDLFGESDLVAARGTMRGAQQREILGVAPQGRRINVDGVLLARLRDGKIAELWVHYDFEALLNQLGVQIDVQ